MNAEQRTGGRRPLDQANRPGLQAPSPRNYLHPLAGVARNLCLKGGGWESRRRRCQVRNVEGVEASASKEEGNGEGLFPSQSTMGSEEAS